MPELFLTLSFPTTIHSWVLISVFSRLTAIQQLSKEISETEHTEPASVSTQAQTEFSTHRLPAFATKLTSLDSV